MAIDRELLEVLACPRCMGELVLKEDESGLVCFACRIVYPIEDDLPIMLLDEAKPLED